MPLENFGPSVPGVSKAEAPMAGGDLLSMISEKLMGRPAAPQQSSGDLIAQAVQLMRQAAEKDVRIAPIVNGALQMMITGGAGPGGAPQPPMGPPGGGGSPMMGPASQAAMPQMPMG